MLKKVLLMLCLGVWVNTAMAAVDGAALPAPAAASGIAASTATVSPAAEQMVRQAIHKLSARAEVVSITPAAMPGFYQVIADGKMLYISADGHYLFNGDLLDLARQQNVSEAAWAGLRKAELARVPAAQRIVFAPPHPKYTVTIFTDVNCGFCRALHEQVDAFNRAGIAVAYLAWPREGVHTTAGRPTPTYSEMESVWCASDRSAAFTAAIGGRAPKPATCSNPVAAQFELGRRLGVDGTPTIIGPDGHVLGGYVTAAQLLQALQAR